MQQEKDPAEDRDEFEKRLKSTLCASQAFDQEKVIEALVKNDTVFLDKMKAAYDYCDIKIADYLTQWDNASTKEEKQTVVGSVKGFSLSDLA